MIGRNQFIINSICALGPTGFRGAVHQLQPHFPPWSKSFPAKVYVSKRVLANLGGRTNGPNGSYSALAIAKKTSYHDARWGYHATSVGFLFLRTTLSFPPWAIYSVYLSLFSYSAVDQPRTKQQKVQTLKRRVGTLEVVSLDRRRMKLIHKRLNDALRRGMRQRWLRMHIVLWCALCILHLSLTV